MQGLARSNSVSCHLSRKEFEALSKLTKKHETMLPAKVDSSDTDTQTQFEPSLELTGEITGELIRKLMDRAHKVFPEASDDPLQTLLWLMDKTRTGYPKVEVRRNASDNTVQIALVARDSQEREKIWADLSDGSFKGFQLAKGGDTTIELAFPNVNKSLTLRWVNQNFPFLLDTMGYQPGALNARDRQLVLFADADDTLYHPQETYPNDPLKANLKESPTRVELLKYLQSGGILGVCTGNDLKRTAKRLLAGIDKSLHSQVLPRIFISGNAGASMAYFKQSANGDFEVADVPGYSTEACKILAQEVSPLKLDASYVGDDQRKEGNDVPGFRYVGDNAYCVSHRELENPDLAHHYPGGPKGTTELLGKINERIEEITSSGSTARIWPGKRV